MLIEKRKSIFCRTTKQDPSLIPSPNLIKGIKITAPDQVYSSDITYIRTKTGFLYLCLTMDIFAKDIVGWSVSDSLKTELVLESIKMASKNKEHIPIIHHSDRGCQFGSKAFKTLLKELGWESSMTEVLHCYENAISERLNGILKDEYFLDDEFSSKQIAIKNIKQVIDIYNNHRLHEKLGYKTPHAFRKEFTKEMA